jgi:hypothetical protein
MDREHMRRIIQLVVLCLVTTDVAAQTSQARGPDVIILQFVRYADVFGSRLVMAFDSIPEAQYGYRPTPTQQTVGYIAQHLEDANYGLCGRLGDSRRPRTARDSLADTVRARWPKDTLVARLKLSLRFCDNALERLGELKSPAIANVLLAFETDLAEHYAQIASYMRMLGLVPPSALPLKSRTAIVLPAQTLAQYGGVYQVVPGWELTVETSDGSLMIRSSLGGGAVQLQPESASDFFAKDVDAQITFTRDAGGIVSGLVLHQYGRQRPARRIR